MIPVTISLDQLTVRYGGRRGHRGHPANLGLDAFTGNFRPGTVTALIGGDGAGKSTLLNVLAGGTVGQTPAADLPVDRRNVGYQPARSGVWANLSVAENIEFVSRVYGLDLVQARIRADRLLTQAGLDEVRDRVAARLSGGMRQKLGVILATLHEPGLVLLDEPTTGVDPISRAELWTMIGAAAAEGATVVFATTYLDEAERASRLYLLGDGKLLASGTPDEVIAQTPGTIWLAPAAGEAARPTFTDSHTWRRADAAYLWTPPSVSRAPRGFVSAVADLENTSIALLLQAEADAHSTALPGFQGLGTDVGIASSRHRAGVQLIESVDVVRSYGDFNALSGVSLRVDSGEIVGLLGGNGAGKTTLMRILLGLETVTGGTTKLFGQTPTLATRNRIGYVTQGLGLYPSLSALENLEFAASVYGLEIDRDMQVFAKGFGHSPVSTLPLGSQRTIAYLAAAQHHPELLVLDEPTSGMDALTRARLWRELRDSADRGAGVLITTHYMQEAAQCNRLAILSSGVITGEGTVQEITADHSSITVERDNWERAFTLLRDASFPVLLDGRTLRVPGKTRGEVAGVLATLGPAFVLSEGRASLEETMMLAARA